MRLTGTADADAVLMDTWIHIRLTVCGENAQFFVILAPIYLPAVMYVIFSVQKLIIHFCGAHFILSWNNATHNMPKHDPGVRTLRQNLLCDSD